MATKNKRTCASCVYGGQDEIACRGRVCYDCAIYDISHGCYCCTLNDGDPCLYFKRIDKKETPP